jgi:hypothetical protein
MANYYSFVICVTATSFQAWNYATHGGAFVLACLVFCGCLTAHTGAISIRAK